MSSIPPRSTPPAGLILADAARQALRAPSIFNTQPWRWRIDGDQLELYADRGRQLPVTDPDGRLLTISCGAALHHARTAILAAGFEAEVERVAGPVPAYAGPGASTASGYDLLATIKLGAAREPEPAETRNAEAIARRRTDRRAFNDASVPPSSLDALRRAVETEGARLHVVREDQLPMLAIATAQAAAAEITDPDYRAELRSWTQRPAGSRDGVPPGTAVRPAPRRVPVRDYAPGCEPGLEVGDGTDRGAVYAILFGDVDDPTGWLRGGEALSALLLTAVAENLAAAPMSDAVELPWPRQLLRRLLSWLGEPFLVLRIGVGASTTELPPAPRRDVDEVVEFIG